MDTGLLAASHEAVKAMAEEVAACSPSFDEGDVGELLIETSSKAKLEMLAKIGKGVEDTGVEFIGLWQDDEGVHVRFMVGLLPLWMIAVISLSALIPVGVIGWKLFRWTPENLPRLLAPFALMAVGAAVVIVRPGLLSLLFGVGCVGGGTYLAIRKPAPPEVPRAALIGFRWEKATTPVQEYAIGRSA